MSNPPSAPKNASPLVRSEARSELPQRTDTPTSHATAPKPSSQALPPAITPPGSFQAESLRGKASRPRLRPPIPNKSHEQLPQLDERDSIFATHYLVNDWEDSAATTPRLLPIPSSSIQDVQHIRQDVAAGSTLSTQATESTVLPRQTRHVAPITSLTSDANLTKATADNLKSLHTDQHNHTPIGTKTDAGRGGIQRTAPSVAHQTPSSKSQDTASRQPRIASSLPSVSLRMSATWTQPEVHGHDGTIEVRNETDTGEQIKHEHRRGSSRGHVEEQIEATLANEEPLSKARSRKASHYLGLFKENAASQELKKSKDKPKEGPKGQEAVKIHEIPPSIRLDDDLDDDAATTTQHVSHPPYATADRLGASDHIQQNSSRQRPSGSPSSTQLQTSPLSDISNKSTAAFKEKILESTDPTESIEWRAGDGSQGVLPLRLLEDIRNHGSVPSTPCEAIGKLPEGLRRASETSRPKVRDSLYDKVNDQSSDDNFPSRHTPEAKSDGGAFEDEYEAENEQIFSATYYPHHAPSPEALEDTDPDQTSPFESCDDAIKVESSSISSVDEEYPIASVETPATLQEQEVKPSLHESYARSRTPSERHRIGPTESGTSSASETDYESWDDTTRSDRGDESGVTDGGEITPTATPKGPATFTRPKLRSKPLRAVELRPYKHQVGGHTHVYSFSKQAICKQLNNRENEFYEVVERRHPELLKFMPRCVLQPLPTSRPRLRLCKAQPIIP